jgi:hypothetical protein
VRRLGFAAAAAVGGALYAGVASGRISIDLRIGRRKRSLGPLSVAFDAPAEVVFDVIAAPYLKATPRAMADKLHVLERGTDLVLAEHHTPVRWGLSALTLETVRFSRPDRIDFRLARGPVPSVIERFELTDEDGRTTLRYTGELETDLWGLGATWGTLVARHWTAAVETSLAGVKVEAERRARSHARTTAPKGGR